MDEQDPEDPGSTLVRSGKDALTFKEMGVFVKDIEERPIARLLDDLPGLMALPDAKYQLVVMVLRRKLRAGGEEWTALLERLDNLQKSAEDPSVRSRVRAFLEKSGVRS
jgi:hypothetical protein